MAIHVGAVEARVEVKYVGRTEAADFHADMVRAERTEDVKRKVEIDADTRGADQAQQAFRGVRREADETTVSLGHYRDASGRLRDEHGRFVASGDRVVASNRRLGFSLREVNGGFSDLVGILKAPALITLLGFAAQGVSSLAAGAIALTSALGPLAGSLAALPSVLSAIGQGMGVFKLATDGIKEALGGSESALKKLTPEGKAFVRLLNGEFKPAFTALQRTAQQGLFGGLVDGLRAARAGFGPLERVVRVTATTLGSLAGMFGRFIGSKGFLRDFEIQGYRNAETLRGFGEAALNVLSAVRHIVLAAGPLVQWMTRLAVSWTASADAAAEAGRETGRLERFFESTRETMERVFSITGSLASAFWDIGKAAAPLGRSILKAFDDAAKGFAAWTGSTNGQNALARYFEQAKPGIFEVGRLIRDVTHAFFELGTQSGFADMVRAVRTELLPALVSVVGATTSAFGPVFIDAITNILLLFSDLAGSSGPLTTFVRLIGDAAGKLHELLTAHPELRGLVVTMMGLAAAANGLRFLYAISGIRTLIGLYSALRTSALAAAAAQRLGIAAAGTSAAAGVGSAAAGAGAAGVGGAAAAGTALAPLLAIVAAVAAIGAGLYLLYKRWDRFHEGVDILGHGIVKVINGIGTALEGIGDVLGVVAYYVYDFVGDVIGAIGKIPGAIKDAFNGTKGAVGGFFKGIAKGLNPMQWRSTGGPVGANQPQLFVTRGGTPFVAGDNPRAEEVVISGDPTVRSQNIGYLKMAARMLGLGEAKAFAKGGIVGRREHVLSLEQKEKNLSDEIGRERRLAEASTKGLTADDLQRLAAMKRQQANLMDQRGRELASLVPDYDDEISAARGSMTPLRRRANAAKGKERDRLFSALHQLGQRVERLQKQRDDLADDLKQLRRDRPDLDVDIKTLNKERDDTASRAGIDAAAKTAFDAAIADKQLALKIAQFETPNDTTDDDKAKSGLIDNLRKRYDELKKRLASGTYTGEALTALQGGIDSTIDQLTSLDDSRGAGKGILGALQTMSLAREEFFKSYGSNAQARPMGALMAAPVAPRGGEGGTTVNQYISHQGTQEDLDLWAPKTAKYAQDAFSSGR